MGNKVIMFAHGGSRNHGCEAIVRSTVKILGEQNYLLVSKNRADDEEYNLNKLLPVTDDITNTISRKSLQGIGLRAKARLTGKEYDLLTSVYTNRKILYKNAVAMSLGGDNYCYYQPIEEIREKLNVFNEYNNKKILWGCSLSDGKILDYAKEDIKKYDLITVRESISYKILEDNNLADKAILCVDPAFQLDVQETEWSNKSFSKNEIIGINLSDLMKHYEAYPDAMYRNFKALCEYIIKNTDYNIAFIPHVIHEGNSDLIPIKKMADELKSDRISVEDRPYNCMQLKSLISKCALFVGCRTHSTIAAYSTCIPTLVMGYSTKARGIARDIFGSEDGYVLPVQDLKQDGDLLKIFIEFEKNKKDVKKHLEAVIPDYKKRAYLAVDAFNSLVRVNV